MINDTLHTIYPALAAMEEIYQWAKTVCQQKFYVERDHNGCPSITFTSDSDYAFYLLKWK